MSWDIVAQDLPAGIRSFEDVPEDFTPGPIGRRSDLIARISALVPTVDFTDPSWGVIDAPGFSVEISLGDDESVESIGFHARGGDAAAGLIMEVLGTLGLRALDPETGRLLDPTQATESLRKWREYRDRVLGSSGAA